MLNTIHPTERQRSGDVLNTLNISIKGLELVVAWRRLKVSSMPNYRPLADVFRSLSQILGSLSTGGVESLPPFRHVGAGPLHEQMIRIGNYLRGVV